MEQDLAEAIRYLYQLGYGKDSISLILKGSIRPYSIDSFLKKHNMRRTIEESRELRKNNSILCGAGYDGMRKEMRKKYPSLFGPTKLT